MSDAVVNQSLLQQLTPAISPIAALLGVWLGKYLETRSQRNAMDLGTSREYYAKFVLCAHDCIRAAVRLIETPARLESATEAHEHLRASVFDLRTRASEIELVGSPSAVDKANQVVEAALNVSDATSSLDLIQSLTASLPDGDANKWPILMTLDDRLQSFISEVRNVANRRH